MRSRPLHRRRTLTTVLLLAAGSVALTACGGAAASGGNRVDAAAPGRKPTINIGPDQHRIHGVKDPKSAALVPARVRRAGFLRIGVGAESSPPLSFYATDDKTLIGVEEDLATLVADTLGLEPRFDPLSWENLFVGLDSGKLDAVFANVTVTEERKEKYDFATYRRDQLAMEAKEGSGWKVRGAADVAGKTIAVGTGTNQEKILVDWSRENEKAGREPVDIKYFQKPSDTYLALQSGRTRPPPTTCTPPGRPRSPAPSPGAATASRARSPPPPGRTAAWSRPMRPPCRRSSTTAATARCWRAGG